MLLEYIGHSAIYIQTKHTRLIIDPWLTDRLDRLWVHWPSLPQQFSFDYKDINVILLTHHHFDHHHFPSLKLLPNTANVFYPKSDMNPKITGSGMGHQVIPYTLRRLGFNKLHPLENFKKFDINDVTITTFPSDVHFPEQSFLIEEGQSSILFCGDCILHQDTINYFKQYKTKLDIAFVPMHSTSPAKPLTQRKHEENYDKYYKISKDRFLQYINLLQPKYVVPSALGWKINTLEGENLSWANRILFPLTIDEITTLIGEARQSKLLIMGPGDLYQIANSNLEVIKEKYSKASSILQFTRDIKFDQSICIPEFNPQNKNGNTYKNKKLIEMIISELIGTGYWLRALEYDRKFVVRLTNDYNDDIFIIDLIKEKVKIIKEIPEYTPYTWLHASTFEELVSSKVLMENSYGLWVSNDMLLPSIFHKAKFYIKHLNDWCKKVEKKNYYSKD